MRFRLLRPRLWLTRQKVMSPTKSMFRLTRFLFASHTCPLMAISCHLTRITLAHYYPLSTLSRQVSFDNNSSPTQISLIYSNDQISLTETMTVQNDSYPINVSWALSPLKSNISNVTLYLTNSFDLQFASIKYRFPN